MATITERDDYTEVIVDRGETWAPGDDGYFSSPGSGWTFSNVLINVENSGANTRFDISGSGWEVRNVGIKGQCSAPSSRHIGFAVSSGSTGIFENVYFGDGDTGSSHGEGGAAFFAYPSHRGTCEFRNVYIAGSTDNGLYGSDPGHPDTTQGEGEVHVYDSYAANNTAANFRLGTDGSFLKNCCSWNGPHRGYWGYFQHTELIDCHIGSSGRDIEVGGTSSVDASYDAEVTATNTYWSTENVRFNNTIHGSSQGTPQHFIPDGTPTSAEAAASGDVGGGGGGGGGGEAEYTTIEVDSGETFSKRISDGETWENILIDITASGAGYTITNDGGEFTMRNIGVRGQWDHDPGSQQIVLDVESSGDSALVENVYLGDGATSSAADPGGIFIHGDHAGEITIRNANIQGFPDNGIYGSDPGTSHSGNFGEVHFESVYAADCGSSGLRLGTENSSATNCVAWGNDRGLWCLFDHIYAEDCDFGNNGHDIRVGSSSQESGYTNAELTVENTRYSSTDVVRSANAIHGSSAGSPQHRGPGSLGAPTSASEAASGSTSGESFQIATADASGISTDSATMHGYVDTMGGADALTIWLQWREAGSVSWNNTGQRAVSSPANISTTLHGLDTFTEYEFRAVGESDGTTNTGEVRSFRTHADLSPLDITFADGLSPFEGDTGSFNVSGGVLTPGSGDGDAIVWRPDMETEVGNTYEFSIEHTQENDADVGLLFGLDPEMQDIGDFTGYMAFMRASDDLIRLIKMKDGTRDEDANGDEIVTDSSADWPLNETLTGEIDFHDNASGITYTLRDESGSQIASVSLDDTQYTSGYGGVYRYHGDGGWALSSYRAIGEGHPATVNHGSGEETVSGIETDRGRVQRMYVNHGDGNGEQLVFDDG